MTSSPQSLHLHDDQELLRAAFRDLHGARLHGFAILASLGDRRRAAAVARTALAAGARRADELRHPERAAAWLRADAFRRLRRVRAGRDTSPADRRAALLALGADEVAFRGLAALSSSERAAIIARDVEGLDMGDVQLILGTDAGRARQIVRHARARYLAAAMPQPGVAEPSHGPVTSAIDEIASRAMGEGSPR